MRQATDVPSITAAQMAEVDRIMTHDLGVDLLQMMENDGRHLADLARRRLLDGDASGQHIVVLAGLGGNGGGALCGARRLHGWGAHVQVLLAGEEGALAPATGRQLDILRRLGIPILGAAAAGDLGRSALVIDGLIGYGLAGAPRGALADLILWANGHGAPILALDVPSGLDATTGAIHEPAMRATATTI